MDDNAQNRENWADFLIMYVKFTPQSNGPGLLRHYITSTLMSKRVSRRLNQCISMTLCDEQRPATVSNIAPSAPCDSDVRLDTDRKVASWRCSHHYDPSRG